MLQWHESIETGLVGNLFYSFSHEQYSKFIPINRWKRKRKSTPYCHFPSSGQKWKHENRKAFLNEHSESNYQGKNSVSDKGFRLVEDVLNTFAISKRTNFWYGQLKLASWHAVKTIENNFQDYTNVWFQESPALTGGIGLMLFTKFFTISTWSS